jgi:hypothetical protein
VKKIDKLHPSQRDVAKALRSTKKRIRLEKVFLLTDERVEVL